MFPAGAPAIALLLLRLGCSFMLWQPWLDAIPQSASLTVLGLGVLSCALCLGLFTPLACLLSAGVELLRATLQIGSAAWPDVWIASVAISLTLLGPGSFSVDARLFGRRVIVT